MTIDELLETYKIFAMKEVEKGERFERLMRNFLLTYPIWRGKISDVWRWKDFPFLKGAMTFATILIKFTKKPRREVGAFFHLQSPKIIRQIKFNCNRRIHIKYSFKKAWLGRGVGYGEIFFGAVKNIGD